MMLIFLSVVVAGYMYGVLIVSVINLFIYFFFKAYVSKSGFFGMKNSMYLCFFVVVYRVIVLFSIGGVKELFKYCFMFCFIIIFLMVIVEMVSLVF